MKNLKILTILIFLMLSSCSEKEEILGNNEQQQEISISFSVMQFEVALKPTKGYLFYYEDFKNFEDDYNLAELYSHGKITNSSGMAIHAVRSISSDSNSGTFNNLNAGLYIVIVAYVPESSSVYNGLYGYSYALVDADSHTWYKLFRFTNTTPHGILNYF